MDAPVITNEIHPVVDAMQAVVSTSTKSQGIDCDLRSNHELLTTYVHTPPERTAVATSDLRTVISYRQRDTLVRSAAAQLSSMAVSKGKGDTVALISDNSVEFVVALLAVPTHRILACDGCKLLLVFNEGPFQKTPRFCFRSDLRTGPKTFSQRTCSWVSLLSTWGRPTSRTQAKTIWCFSGNVSAPEFLDGSLNEWMRPKLIVKEHTNRTDQDIDGIPDGKTAVRSDNRSRDSRYDVSQLAQIDCSGSGGQR
jgi:hypothetical protein